MSMARMCLWCWSFGMVGRILLSVFYCLLFFFFQAEDGIRDIGVTGVQTCALPISTFRTKATSRLMGRGTERNWEVIDDWCSHGAPGAGRRRVRGPTRRNGPERGIPPRHCAAAWLQGRAMLGLQMRAARRRSRHVEILDLRAQRHGEGERPCPVVPVDR